MKVGIVGGGITGVSLAYFLTLRGVSVEIFEASPILGGLAGPLQLQDGTSVDRFYHAILASDDELQTVCTQLNLVDQLRFQQTRNAFFVKGVLSTMNSAVEFLRFPPLNIVERVRLATTILRAQFIREWQELENVSVHAWLRRWSGRGVFEKLWRPMLDAKFDKIHDQIPATWMWSRLVRMKSTRSGANQRESSGHLIGGYATLLAAMAARIEAAGGRIHLSHPVEEIVIQQGRAVAVRTADGTHEADAIVSTMQAPVSRRLIPGAPRAYQEALSAVPYLGVVCPLVVLDRPLTGYWVVNIADASVPFTGVIETTTYIDPKYVGGHHLVYLPKYTAAGSPWFEMSNDEIRDHTMKALARIAPGFDPHHVRQILIHRERYVEPLHRMNGLDPIPAVQTPVENLYLATTAQIYPALTNGESVIRHARGVADLVIANAGAATAAGTNDGARAVAV